MWKLKQKCNKTQLLYWSPNNNSTTYVSSAICQFHLVVLLHLSWKKLGISGRFPQANTDVLLKPNQKCQGTEKIHTRQYHKLSLKTSGDKGNHVGGTSTRQAGAWNSWYKRCCTYKDSNMKTDVNLLLTECTTTTDIKRLIHLTAQYLAPLKILPKFLPRN